MVEFVVRTFGVTGLLGSALLVSGCGSRDAPAVPDVTLRFESEHFVYYAGPHDGSVCAATLDRMETHFDVVVPYLGLQWPAGRKITYYKLEPVDVMQHCGYSAAGCVVDGNVYTSEPLITHELIHAYLSIEGDPPRVFEEGTAELLSGSSSASEIAGLKAQVDALSSQDLLDWNWGNDDAYYGAALRLVNHLAALGGIQKYVQLYAALDRIRDVRAADAALESLYGTTFGRVWQDTKSSAFEPPPSRTPIECAHGPALESGQTVRTTATVCGADDQFDQNLFLDVPTNTLVSLRADGKGFFGLDSCDSERQVPDAIPTSLGNGTPVLWYASLTGRYFIGALPQRAITFSRNDAQTHVFATCTEAEAAPLGVDASLLISLSPDHAPAYVAIDIPEGTAMEGFESQNPSIDGASHVELCSSCAALGSCQAVGVNDYGHRFADARHAVIVVKPDPGQPWPYVNAQFDFR